MPEPELDKELSQLLEAVANRDLTDSQRGKLEERLSVDPSARAAYIKATAMEAMLAHEFPSTQEDVASTALDLPQPAASRLRSLLPWAIAAAATIMALVGWIGQFSKESDTTAPSDPFVALLVDEAGAHFSDGNEPSDVRFQPGSYQLQRGAIHVRFANGADVVMEAPAAFDIDDAFHVRLRHGGIRAIVPPSAHGFTVATPGVDYEDIGTEFGISVDRDTGVSQLHVFEGQVDAKEPGSKELMSSITEGQSVRYTDGSLQRVDELSDEIQFLTPGSIGYLRWKQQRADFGDGDPDLIAYYPFTQSDFLINEASHSEMGNARINGARWVSGRWPGKSALLFDRDTDFVELDIPGEFEELSFAAWVKIDRLDFSYNTIFNSNGWGIGDIHWQINRTGSMWFVPRTATRTKQVAEQLMVPTDQWVHLAGTLSRESLLSKVYINGKLAGSKILPVDTLMKPGVGRIGGWQMEEDWPQEPLRSLRARMDEFAIWRRALTEAEIKELVERGKPTALWPVSNR